LALDDIGAARESATIAADDGDIRLGVDVAARSRTISSLKAFSFSGRFSVMTAMRPSCR